MYAGFKSQPLPLYRELSVGQEVIRTDWALWGFLTSAHFGRRPLSREQRLHRPQAASGAGAAIQTRDGAEEGEGRAYTWGVVPPNSAAWYSEGSEEENEHPGSFFSDSGRTRGLSLATSGSTDGAATVWFRWAFTLRPASWRHRVTYPESGLLARESETRWVEVRLLKFAVWGGGCPRRSLSDPVSYLSTCALCQPPLAKNINQLHLWRRLVLAGVESGDGQPSAVSGSGERLRCSGGSRTSCPHWSFPVPHRQGEGIRSSAGGSSPAPSRGLLGPASGAARATCPRLKFPSLESRWSYFTGILLFWKMFHSLWHIVSASSLSPQVVAVLTKIYWLGIVSRCLSNSPLLTAQPLATRD